MESGTEGDEIILLALRQIGCGLPEELKSVSALTPEMLVEVLARALWLISNGEVKFSVQLPANIASRHRICTNMATKVKELGFTGDCGYNQLLYPVEAQTRTLMTWIVQRLPRSEEEQAEEVLGANALLNKRIMSSLLFSRQVQWRLSQCSAGTPLRNMYQRDPVVTVSAKKLNDPDIRGIYKATSDAKFAVESSLFERHAMERLSEARAENSLTDMGQAAQSRANMISAMVKDALSAARQGIDGDPLSKSLQDLVNEMSGSDPGKTRHPGTRFTHASEFAQELKATLGSPHGANSASSLSASLKGLDAEDAAIRRARLEAEVAEREQELENLRQSLQTAQAQCQAQERHQVNTSSKIRQLESELAGLLTEGEQLEKEIMIKRKTLEMLPSAAENISKLQGICGQSAKRLMQLAQEWETHRRPLVEKLRELKSNKMQRRNKCLQMVDEMKRCREEMAGMIQDLKDKQVRAQTLAEELSKLPKNINRTIYTHRIMDIISSIGKQNKDIDKITGDIRDIQKTINNSTLTLQRADAVAEELIYQAANGPGSDHAMVDTYRRLKTLRAKFEALVSTVGKIGVSEKSRRDLETKIDQEATRVSSNNVDRIKGDLEQVVKENVDLVAQIKRLTR